MNEHLGSSFSAFLEDEGLLDECREVATKRVLALQIAEAMKTAGLSHEKLARRMQTKRSTVTRLLDPNNPSVTLITISKAVRALGGHIEIMIVMDPERSTTLDETGERKKSPAAESRRRVKSGPGKK